MRALIGQLPIYYLPVGDWWRTLAHAQSRTRHFVRDYIFFYLVVCKDFSLRTERKFNDTFSFNERLTIT